MTTLHTNADTVARPMDAQQLHFTPPKSHRFLFLDALRGIAALFVVAFHIPPAMTSSFAPNGPLAVDFFFCLSGFVIAFSYERRLTGTMSLKDFAVARLIRLYPIYALGSLLGLLSLILVLHFVFHGAESWSSSLSLFTLALFIWPTRLSPLTDSFNYPLNIAAWSLFYEIFANLAYGSLVKLRASRTFVLIILVSTSMAVMAYAVLSGKGVDEGGRQAGFGLGFARVSLSFFLGVLICRLYRSRAAKRESIWVQRFLPLLITLALVGILNSPLSWMRTEGFRFVAISMCFPVMVYYGTAARLPSSFTRLSTALGELSYPLYLLHSPLVSLLRARRLVQFTGTHPLLVHITVPCTIATFAFLSWQVGEHIDLPIRRALTRRYNSFKEVTRHPISVQASMPE